MGCASVAPFVQLFGSNCIWGSCVGHQQRELWRSSPHSRRRAVPSSPVSTSADRLQECVHGHTEMTRIPPAPPGLHVWLFCSLTLAHKVTAVDAGLDGFTQLYWAFLLVPWTTMACVYLVLPLNRKNGLHDLWRRLLPLTFQGHRFGPDIWGNSLPLITAGISHCREPRPRPLHKTKLTTECKMNNHWVQSPYRSFCCKAVL